MAAKISNEARFVEDLIGRIVRECPRRQPTSEDERRASGIVQEVFEQLGLETRMEAFEFNDNLYANICLHFGLASLGTAVSGMAPWAALPLHLLAGASYRLDSTRRAYLLRRLLRFKPSQNVLAVLPAEGEPRLRVVINAHIDAAFTGFIFDPRLAAFLSAADGSRLGKLLHRPLALATNSQFALAGIDLLRMMFGPLTLPLRPLEYALSAIPAIAFAATLEVVLRDQIVPGANDDLSGVAALPVLASRLARTKPAEVELVFVATGCEEASMGGADAMLKAHKGDWAEQITVGLSLEMLGHGELLYLEGEGEVVARPTPPWLAEATLEAAASDPRFKDLRGFQPPVGGSDAAAFLANGYDAIALCRLDRSKGTADHYHLPSDTPANLDMEQIMEAVDFAELLVNKIVERRLS